MSRSENDDDGATTDPRTVSLFFDGVQVGEVTNDGSGRGDYAAVLARRSAEMVRTPKQATEAARSSFRNGRPVNQADFDQAFQSISPESGAATAGTWTVHEGDSLQAIAVAAWGDASLWWVIAEAIGLDGAAPLQAGTSLSLPAGVRSAGNTVETSRPYDLRLRRMASRSTSGCSRRLARSIKLEDRRRPLTIVSFQAKHSVRRKPPWRTINVPR